MKHGLEKFICAGLLVTAVQLAPISAFATTDDSNVFQLGEVIVSAEQQTVDLATTVTEIDAEDITQRGASTVAEALEMLPGVDVVTGGKGQSYVKVRGFDQGDLKVMIDGIPVYEQYFRDLDLAQIPVASIAKITVTKGASSVLYGANTMGGVINIITKTATTKPTLELNAEWGDYGTQNYTLNTGVKRGNFSYWLSYNFSESDAYNLSDDFDKDAIFNGTHSVNGNNLREDGGSRDDSGYERHAINAKLGWEPSDDSKVFLTLDYHNNEKGIPERTWTFTDWTQWTLGLVGETQATDWLRLKGRVYYMKFDDELTETLPADSSLMWRRYHQFYKSTYDNYTVGAETQAFINVGEHNLLKIGFNYALDDHKSKDLLDTGWTDEAHYQATTYSVALEDEISISDRLSVVVGTSYDVFDPEVKHAADAGGGFTTDRVDALNPQIGLVYSLTPRTSVHASIGKKTRFPHLKELYTRASWIAGNYELDPQQTIAYEIGVEHHVNNDLVISGAYFYNDVSDLIDTITDSASSTKVYVNVDEATIQGVELSADYHITRDLSTGLNYTYLKTEDESTGKELFNRPRHRANLDVRYRFPFGLSTSVQTSYVAHQYYEDNNTYERVKAKNYLLLNARIEQEIFTSDTVSGRLYVTGHNLTDKYYVEAGELTAGRTVLAGLNIRF